MTVAQALKNHSVAYRNEVIPAEYQVKFADDPTTRQLAQSMLFTLKSKWITTRVLADFIREMAVRQRVSFITNVAELLKE